MDIDLKLKNGILLSGQTQRQVCRKANISESILSQAIHKRTVLNDEEKKRLAYALNMKVDEIFDNE